jgi:DNA-binding MarR family transcriptional regulator
MRTATITILLALAAVCFAINNQLASGGHGVYAEYYLIAGILFSLAAVILAPIFAINWSKSAAADNSPQISALPKNPTLRKAVIRLQSIYDHLSTADLSETYVNDYHAILDTVQAEIHEDLSPFRIPQSELRRHVSNIGWEGAYSGWQISQTKELFCPPEVFRIALSGALNFIKTYEPPESPKGVKAKTDPPKQLQKAVPPSPSPTTQDEFVPDGELINVLRYIAVTSELAPIDNLALALGRRSHEIYERAGILMKHGFLSPGGDSGIYRLTDKGKKCLYEHDFKVPYPSLKDELDETAVKVLVKIEEKIGHEHHLAKALNIEPLQIRRSLRLLEWRGYIRLLRHTEHVMPFYLITDEGTDYLNQTSHKVRQPSAPEPEDYEPDKTSAKILYHIKIGNKYDSILAAGLRLKEEQVRPYLLLLEKHGYIVRHEPSVAAPYSELTKKGTDYLIKSDYKVPTPSPSAPSDYKPDQIGTQILVQIKKGNCFESEIANALELDPKQARISLALLEQYGYILLQRPSERAPFYLLSDKGSEWLLKTPVNSVPHPNPEQPNEAEKKILTLLASLDCYPVDYWLAEALSMSLTRLQFHLGELTKRDYVTANTFNDHLETVYQLTQKARRFLIENNLID